MDKTSRQKLWSNSQFHYYSNGVYLQQNKTTVFLKNISDYKEMNEVYAEYFTENPPARTALEVANLPKDAIVEIEVIAHLPLQSLQIDLPDYIKIKKTTPFSSTDRFVKHIIELGKSLESHQRAILLNCFIYDNPGFQVIERSTNYEQVNKAVGKSISLGVEMWQVNFKITTESVTLERYFKLSN